MNRFKRILFTLLICMPLFCQTTLAKDADFAQFLADAYRLNTGADIAVVTYDDALNAKNTNDNLVIYTQISPSQLYNAISSLVEGENRPYLSGATVEIKTSLGGSTHDIVEKITIDGKVLDNERLYTIALGANASSAFDVIGTKEEYTSNDMALYEYANSFKLRDEQAKDTSSTQQDSLSNNEQILANQTRILTLALVVLAIVIIIYLIIKKKRNCC